MVQIYLSFPPLPTQPLNSLAGVLTQAMPPAFPALLFLNEAVQM